MNLFETVKNSVTVKQAAERYGYKDNRSDTDASQCTYVPEDWRD